ncbi:unnamed protein product [Spirodela intermedia]|uniref:WD repeat-containing protein 76 n=1 Tax=Spirodela intermedia TaxID=51605 RepID=A0A7I8IUI2_SPIIN|nr:unnamed protein product [Spirodela intermedia]CAA6661656.1 unnamed protein product [Spirodela intermedia]
MATAALTEYERRRMENIRRNEEMIASLKRKAEDLSAIVKASKARPHRPAKPHQPAVVIRRSLRCRGIPPEQSREASDLPAPSSSSKVHDFRHGGECAPAPEEEACGGKWGSWDPATSLTLVPENVRRLLPGRILTVCFFPFGDRRVVAAGDKLGHLGFWDGDFGEGAGDGSYIFAPHTAPVSGISFHPFSLSKIFSCSYDGFIRLMDVEENLFNMVYSTEEAVFSISHQPNDAKSIYFGEGPGELKAWDEKAGKVSNSWVLHDQRINTIDFSRENTNLMATSSTDGVACIWDLRKIRAKKPEGIRTVRHARAVHSAYFSPSGASLATTSIDDTVGILSGPNFDNSTMISHFNQTGRWLSSFRAIWGWDDRFLFMGNMKRAVDVISTVDKTRTALESPLMTAIPCRFAAHPHRVGLLAGATAGGQIYMWSQ